MGRIQNYNWHKAKIIKFKYEKFSNRDDNLIFRDVLCSVHREVGIGQRILVVILSGLGWTGFSSFCRRRSRCRISTFSDSALIWPFRRRDFVELGLVVSGKCEEFSLIVS